MGTKTPTYLEKLKAERDELAAELERVKAEMGRVQKSCNRWRYTAYKKNRELKDLKSRLPVNADGDVVFIGDYVFVGCRGLDHPMRLKVTGFREEDDGLYITTKNGRRLITDCHSTAESCAAHGGEGR